MPERRGHYHDALTRGKKVIALIAEVFGGLSPHPTRCITRARASRRSVAVLLAASCSRSRCSAASLPRSARILLSPARMLHMVDAVLGPFGVSGSSPARGGARAPCELFGCERVSHL